MEFFKRFFLLFLMLFLIIPAKIYSLYSSRMGTFWKIKKLVKRYGTRKEKKFKTYDKVNKELQNFQDLNSAYLNSLQYRDQTFGIIKGSVRTITHSNILPLLEAYHDANYRKYHGSVVPYPQTWWGKIKDWWALRNLPEKEQNKIKNIIHVLRPDQPTRYERWFENVEKIIEKYKNDSSPEVQKNINDIRLMVKQIIHKRTENIWPLHKFLLTIETKDISAEKKEALSILLKQNINNLEKQISVANQIGASISADDLKGINDIIRRLEWKIEDLK